MGRLEMEQIGDWIERRLAQPDDEEVQMTIRNEVERLTARFPVPG
jgi:glycine/serine hydroxymethyltransferase